MSLHHPVTGRRLIELKVFYKVGTNENPAELRFLSALSELTGCAGRPRLCAAALNKENSRATLKRFLIFYTK